MFPLPPICDHKQGTLWQSEKQYEEFSIEHSYKTEHNTTLLHALQNLL
jgi:hypothetical protein